MPRIAHRNYYWICAAVIVLGSAGIWYWFNVDKPNKTAPQLELSPLAATRFQNTSGEARYVGNKACVECHNDENESYLKTTHSRALDRLDANREPPSTEYLHELSDRWYRVYREDDRMRHRESVRTQDGHEVVLADYEIDYVIGSGAHSRSYLVETDGFLIESPVTWYATPKKWEMSPGYDRPRHPGFSRPVHFDCVLCHSGQVERVDDSLHRMNIHEMSITCERCHGPGSLHVDGRRSDSEVEGEDLTIVNPARLDRERQVDVCAQCHLAAPAQVDVRGRQMSDYRPGLALNDFVITYVPESSLESDDQMTVTGHVEQMKLSRCYTESETMSCMTCHNPHQPIAAEELVAFYRDKCLTCHDVQSCEMEEKERLERDAQDYCVRCHMPTSDTEIVHFAFTHHRIGLHDSNEDKPADGTAETLVALDDVSRLSEIDRQRCLGLAYLYTARESEDANLAEMNHRRAKEALNQVAATGLADSTVHAELASMHWQSDPQKSIDHATQALDAGWPTPTSRHDAMSILAAWHTNTGSTDRAIEFLEQLVRLERRFEHWTMLAECRRRQGDLSGAIEAAQQAAKIEPGFAELQTQIAELYEQSGDKKLATEHRQRARQLNEVRAKNSAPVQGPQESTRGSP
jgi:hypothetical protein